MLKKFDKTTEFYNDPNIPRTNNKIEGYFNITLPKSIKRKFRTRNGLIDGSDYKKIRCRERNVLIQKTLKSKTKIKNRFNIMTIFHKAIKSS